MPLTEADQDALTRMPEGWFKASELEFMVKRPFYRCERLEGLGALESRITGTFPDLVQEYRRTPCSPTPPAGQPNKER